MSFTDCKFEFPNHWQRVSLEEILEFKNGINFSAALKGSGILTVDVLNMYRGRLDVHLDGLYRVDLKVPPEKLLQTGDILFVRSSVKETGVGWPAVFSGYYEPVTYCGFIIRGRPRHNEFDPRFLIYYLRQTKVRQQMIASSGKTAITNISQERLKQIIVPLPPLAEQKRIAAILDKADTVRRKRREALQLFDSFLQSAYLEIVGQENPDYRKWPKVPISELAEPSKNSMRTGPFGSTLRHSEFVSEGIAVLGIDNAVQNKFVWAERRFITPAKYESLKRYTVKPGDVIITIMGTTGRSAVVPDNIPVAITTKHLAAITLNRGKAIPEYLSNAIHRDPFVLHQIALRNRGAIMAGLNLGIIRELNVGLPPIEKQKQFQRIVQKIRQTEIEQAIGVEITTSLFDSLVQRAFKGKL